MEYSDVNRRGFLKTSASAVAVGAGLSAGSLSAAALSRAEVTEWQSHVGRPFNVGDAVLQLQSVDAADHSADPARPKNLRTHSIAALFVLQSGRVDCEHDGLQYGGEKLHVSQVVPPQGKAGEFFEVVLN